MTVLVSASSFVRYNNEKFTEMKNEKPTDVSIATNHKIMAANVSAIASPYDQR